MAGETLNVGPRIRELREERGLSLRALAEECTLSVNAISMIERGETSPKVSTLHLLAKALEVLITDFFVGEEERSTVFVRGNQRQVTRSGEVSIESAGTGLRNQQLEPLVLTLEPKAGGSPSGSPTDAADASTPDVAEEMITHAGQEFVFCLSGRVLYCVGEEYFHLQGGDSLLFDARQPHSFRNESDDPAELLLVLQAPEGTGVARERHLRL